MPDGDTQLIVKEAGATPRPASDGSRAFGVSIRGWLVIMTTTTICILVLLDKPIDMNFATQWGMMVAFYFANKPPSPPTTS